MRGGACSSPPLPQITQENVVKAAIDVGYECEAAFKREPGLPLPQSRRGPVAVAARCTGPVRRSASAGSSQAARRHSST
jgi:hypothetical protein